MATSSVARDSVRSPAINSVGGILREKKRGRRPVYVQARDFQDAKRAITQTGKESACPQSPPPLLQSMSPASINIDRLLVLIGWAGSARAREGRGLSFPIRIIVGDLAKELLRLPG